MNEMYLTRLHEKKKTYPPREAVLIVFQPYSYNPHAAFETACHVVRWLTELGYVVFSPILHTHHYDQYWKHPNPVYGEIYYVWDLGLYERLLKGGSVAAVFLDGWENSPGCQFEHDWAVENNVPCYKIHQIETAVNMKRA